MKSIKTVIFSLILFIAFVTNNILAQKFEITPYVGYQFAGGLNTLDGRLSMKNGPNYGLILDITVEKDMQAGIGAFV